MKKLRKNILLASAMLLLVSGGLQAAGSLTASDILTKADDISSMKSSKIYMTQKVISPTGQTRTFKMVSYSENGNEKGLTEYLAPSQVKGMKILTLNDGDDIWSYFPRTNRTRKIASSARNRKVQGSDFTYDDMASGKMNNKWKGKVLGKERVDGVESYKLALTPTASGPKSYSKSIAWIDAKNFTALKIEYYDLDGDKFKRLTIGDYKKISNVWVPHKYTMTNLTDGGKTVMTVAKAYINVSLKSGTFSESTLGN